MVKLLRIVGVVFLLVGLVSMAAVGGFQLMQAMRQRIWSFEQLPTFLCGGAFATVGMITLALLEIRDAISEAALAAQQASKPELPRRNIDVRTSYLDIRER